MKSRHYSWVFFTVKNVYCFRREKNTNLHAKLILLDIILSVQKESLAIALTFTKVSEFFKFQFYFKLEQIFLTLMFVMEIGSISISMSLISHM